MVQHVIEALKAVTDDIFAPSTGGHVLHRAIFVGSEPITRLLLDHGADPSAADGYGTTALAAAVIWGYDNIVNLLLDRGADVLPYDSIGRSALTSAAGDCGFATVQRLVKATLEAGGDISLRRGDDGFTPLHYYALQGNLSGVELLINSGADVLVRAEAGVTALTCSLVRYKDNEIIHEKICRVLIGAMNAAGADFSVPSENPLGSGITPLHLTADLGAESLGRLLIDSGADALALDQSERSPLLLAMLSGHEAVCRLLIQEMRVRGYNFSTPLPSLPEVAELGDTLLHLAVARQMEHLCKLLVDCGADEINAEEHHLTRL